MSDESLELAQVQEAFRKAQEEFVAITNSANALQDTATQLDEAGSSLTDAGSRLADLASQSAEVSARLAAATEAIERTDPAAIQARLGELDEAISDLRESTAAQANKSEQADGHILELVGDASARTMESIGELSESLSGTNAAVAGLSKQLRLTTYINLGVGVLVVVVLVLLLIQ